MERIANKQGVTATEKLINIFLFSSSFRNNRKSLLQYLHEDKNAHLHLKFERKIPTKTIQPLSKIIIQGIHEKTFTTPYPEEAAKAFIGITALVLQGIYHIQPGSTDFIRKFNATFDFLEKILGAQPHTLLNMYQLKGGHYL